VYDEGPIIVQHAVPVHDDDTPHDIADRVFAEECNAFPEAVNRVHDMGIDYFWDRINRGNK
jgi:phosphoribosylglycinamide formyltransferase-1